MGINFVIRSFFMAVFAAVCPIFRSDARREA
jgi:hypothetical protein